MSSVWIEGSAMFFFKFLLELEADFMIMRAGEVVEFHRWRCMAS